MNDNFRQGVWRLADPKISLASFAGLFLAACMAAADHGISPLWLAATIAAVFAVEVAKNAYGEIVDYDSGADLAVADADRSPFSGGKRVLVDGLLTRQQASAIAIACYLCAIVLGLAIMWLREPRVLSFGLVGMALAWYYHGGSLRLSYRGLGELAVVLCYGPLVVCGCYLVQTGVLTAPVIQASLALGLLVGAFLWINEFPDYRADESSGKRNLVVRLGLDRAALGYVVILTSGYFLLVLTGLIYPSCTGLLWGLVGAPAALFSCWRTLHFTNQTQALIPAQAACLASFVLMAVGAGLGYLLTGG
jgi:1,4-dihydroxy-2-naphthoate octaprenyltransferase